MNVDLTERDLEVLAESLKYARQKVADAQGTPYDVRQENLRRIDVVREKIAAAKK